MQLSYTVGSQAYQEDGVVAQSFCIVGYYSIGSSSWLVESDLRKESHVNDLKGGNKTVLKNTITIYSDDESILIKLLPNHTTVWKHFSICLLNQYWIDPSILPNTHP